MGWLIFFAILFLLGCLPLGVRLRYDENGALAALLLGRIPITLYPVPDWLKKRTSKKKKPKEAEPGKPKEETPKQEESKSRGGSLKKILPFVQLGLSFLGDFRRKLRVNNLVLKLTLAGGDPCDLAMNYGRAWAALANLLPQLERVFAIRKRDVQIQCDFLEEETKIVFGMDMTITLGRLLGLTVVYGIRTVKIIQTMKKNKAVQTNE